MLVSVYISNSSVTAVSAKLSGRKIIVKNTFSGHVPEGLIINGVITNDTALSSSLRDFFSYNSLPSKDIRLVISGKDILSKVINIPHTSHSNIIKLIKSEYSDMNNISEFIFDYTVINQHNPDGTASVLACAVHRDVIESYINVFKNAGLEISSINTEVNSEIKLMRCFRELQRSTYLLAPINGNILSPALFADGKFIFSSSSRLIEERFTNAFINETAGIISSFIQFSKTHRTESDITDVYFCGISEDKEICREISELLNINADILHECPEFISADNKNFMLSDYVCSIGNLVRP